jgi:hypothetical protein
MHLRAMTAGCAEVSLTWRLVRACCWDVEMVEAITAQGRGLMLASPSDSLQQTQQQHIRQL